MDNCTIISLILAAKSKQKSILVEVDVRFNLLSLTFWCWELSKDFMKTEEDDIFVNKSFSFLQVDVSAVNLRLQYSSYFLFVMVITCVLYGMIKGRPVKQSKKVQIGTHSKKTSSKGKSLQEVEWWFCRNCKGLGFDFAWKFRDFLCPGFLITQTLFFSVRPPCSKFAFFLIL